MKLQETQQVDPGPFPAETGGQGGHRGFISFSKMDERGIFFGPDNLDVSNFSLSAGLIFLVLAAASASSRCTCRLTMWRLKHRNPQIKF